MIAPEAKNKSDHIRDVVPKAVPSFDPGVNAFSASIRSKTPFTVSLISLSVVKHILLSLSLPIQRPAFNILVMCVCVELTSSMWFTVAPEVAPEDVIPLLAVRVAT